MYSHAAVAAAITQNAQGEWFRHRLGLDGATLVEDPLLKGPVAASRDTGAIYVPPALDFAQVYRRATEALLYIVGGVEWAPAFCGLPDPPALATVLPFQRPGSGRGAWQR